MKNSIFSLLALLPFFAAAATPELLPPIPYTRYTLDNGLTLIVHEDHKAPIVAVNVWYHVGSKNEKPGRTGLAHLFEHLMFNGSEHFKDEWFRSTEKVGATDLNGTTSDDRTNYFQNVPKDALDYMLWLESDRMGHFLGVFTQEKLDEQRGVVQNEKRQGDNQPYRVAWKLITENVWPKGHPYSWEVIGSMEDLSAATLDDAKTWFKTYYGAANATLVIAGDVKADEVLQKVKLAFGNIPAGPPLTRQSAWIAKRTGTHRQRAHDRVPAARIYKVWNIPGYGNQTATHLDVAASILGDGQNSRLYQRLVCVDKTATDVSVDAHQSEIAGLFFIVATAREDRHIPQINAAIDEELARFLNDGPRREELSRVKTQAEANFIGSLERIGGFGGKSDMLAMNSVYLNDPSYYLVRQEDIQSARAYQIREAAKTWLSDGEYQLTIEPYPQFHGETNTIDRTKVSVPLLQPQAHFPAISHAKLRNGLHVVLAPRPGVPMVKMSLISPRGFTSDPVGGAGTARLTMNVLPESTRHHSAERLAARLALLGASISASASLENSSVSLSALKKNLEASLSYYVAVIAEPGFADVDFQRLQAKQVADIRRETREPMSMAMRLMPYVLYGPQSAYGRPLSGNGFERDVSGLKREACVQFYHQTFTPATATLLVTGDFTREEMLTKLERSMGHWKIATPHAVARPATYPTYRPTLSPSITLIDKPGAGQSVIVAANLAPPRDMNSHLACELMNQVLGGAFTSRINMNLREEKHWTYGARSAIVSSLAVRPFYVSTQVQTDKTVDAMHEIAKEINDLFHERPISDAEFQQFRNAQALRLSGRWETLDHVMDSLVELVTFRLPDDYFQMAAQRAASATCLEARQAAISIIQPKNLSWIIVGDRAKIEASLKASGLGEMQILQDCQ
jgi:zinc protease